MKIAVSYWPCLAVAAAVMFAATTTAQDPTDCEADGERFNCFVNNVMALDETTTAIASVINCKLDPAIGMDFLQAEDCLCQATLTSADKLSRTCNCAVCPSGLVSLDCSVVTDDPFIFGTCTSMDCSGQCGDGGGGIATDTPAPAPTTAPPASGSARWTVGTYQHVMTLMGTLSFMLS